MHVISTGSIFLLGYTFSYMTAASERRDVPFCLAVHLEHDSDTCKDPATTRRPTFYRLHATGDHQIILALEELRGSPLSF